jgi:tRNA(Ile)-lysidine synthase
MSDDLLSRDLAARLAKAPAGALCVGFSGGMDSTVLLHALAALPAARERGLRALHIDHGLNAASNAWARSCAEFCAALAIPFAPVEVRVENIDELGVEGAARKARYAAFASQLSNGELLVLAHHRDDQAETLLLRLLHGAGHEGLAGMRPLRRFEHAWLWRPLLDISRETLRDYAAQHALQWIEDPSNSDSQHARNHVRNQVMPALAARWPDASRRIAAAASRMREESEVLDAATRTAFNDVGREDPDTLDLDALRALAPALRRSVIACWLDARNLPRPPPGIWLRLADLLDAREDASPLLSWHGAELRRYRTTLYAMRPLPPTQTDWKLDWTGAESLQLPAGFGRLSLEPATTFDAPIIVRARRGGERLDQPGSHRELRTLLQDLGIPPWVRERLPLLCSAAGDVLAAADLALSPAFAKQLAERRARLLWQRAD